MNKILYTFLWYIFTLQFSFADWGFLWNFKNDSETDTDRAIREWDIHLDDIPVMIKWAIDFFISIAWTIAIIFIIVWAYKILFGSLESDKTKWKNTILMAIWWFSIAALAWFIVKLVIDNFS